MKKETLLTSVTALGFIVISTIILSCSGPQTLTTDGKPVPYRVNTIYIPINGDKTEAFDNFSNHLLINGYSIENMNERLLTLRTHYKSAAKRGSDMSTDVALTVSAVEVNEKPVIMLFGSFRQGMRLPTAPNLGESRIYHFGQTGSMARVAWNEMYNIASTFSQNLIFDTR